MNNNQPVNYHIENKPEEMLSPKDIKKQEILEQILLGTPTKKQIAENVDISRPTLNKYLREMDKNRILGAELEGLKDEILPIFREIMENPEHKQWKTSADNMMKWILKLQDKNAPNLQATTHINIDLAELQQEREEHRETISRLPPNIRQLYHETRRKVHQEWTQ